MAEQVTNVNELLNAFVFEGELSGVRCIEDGHINSTFVFEFRNADGKTNGYLIQKLNTNVFKEPVGLMNNMLGVTEFLGKKVKESGGDVDRECLKVFNAKDGKPYYIDSEGSFWRCLNFVYDTYTVQQVTDPGVFRAAAESFGKFQCLLADYPSETLVETIPNFHNTVSRFADFKKAVEDNLSGRADQCEEETGFILAREKDCGLLLDMLKEGKLPLRVTHNDTKLNNVLFDKATDKGICVVDLDTVMPGLSLYDFGDSIRFGASTAAEDEPDLDKVHFSPEYFRAYTEGFLSAAGKALTKAEIENLAFSSKLMTLECGMRFLGDFINGDTYFKVDYPTHNLVRCRTQLKLVFEMEAKLDEMNEIVNETCKKLGL